MKKIAVGQLYLLTREDDGESFEAVVTWTDGAFMCLTDGCCDYKHWPDSPGTPVLLEERAGWWDDKGPPDTDIVVWAWDRPGGRRGRRTEPGCGATASRSSCSTAGPWRDCRHDSTLVS